jgi:hypothetical protein
MGKLCDDQCDQKTLLERINKKMILILLEYNKAWQGIRRRIETEYRAMEGRS